jgi:hypothetical protein
MSTRLFALIIGIDNYKSGSIWNLHGCVEDAKKIKHWLTDNLNVPKDQICLLLDKQATKHNIEEHFMRHLVANPCIEKGDAILIYFAGHGSSLHAPADWHQRGCKAATVQLLCPYDHDTKSSYGRISGISDRSFHAMMNDLSVSKGDNITVLLDCCFAPTQTLAGNFHDRSVIRRTPTSKATPKDLYHDLWPSARGMIYESRHGFFQQNVQSHVTLIACSARGRAVEDKAGGKFTSDFLRLTATLPLHQTSYVQLLEHVKRASADSQPYVCLGSNRNRVIFNEIPFAPDRRLSRATLDLNTKLVRIEFGEIHGIIQGSDLSLHHHNRQCSRNPSFGSVVVTEVRSSWSFAKIKSQGTEVPKSCWAKVLRWNNRRPFRVYLKSTFLTFIRMWKLQGQFPTKPGVAFSSNGLSVIRVKHPNLADVSLTVGQESAIVVQHSLPLLDQERRVVLIRNNDGVQIIDDAALFNLHLLNKNPASPLQNLIQMELYRLDSTTWGKVGVNTLHNSTAMIPYQAGAIYQVVIRNHSHRDLWPYLAYMDPSRYGVTLLYQPDPSSKDAPLPSRGQLEIGSGKPGSEALSFALSNENNHDYGYLKLFVSSNPVDLRMLGRTGDLGNERVAEEYVETPQVMSPVWDTILASLVFTRPTNSEECG